MKNTLKLFAVSWILSLSLNHLQAQPEPSVIYNKGDGYPGLMLYSDGDGTHNNSIVKIGTYGSGGSADLNFHIQNWNGIYSFRYKTATVDNENLFEAITITKGGGGSGGPDAGYGIFNVFGLNKTVAVQILGNGDSYFNGGNVGIGTDEPDEKLSVYGGQLLVENSTGTSTISNPSTLRLSSTNTSSDWSVVDTWANIDFESNDGSGAGSGVRARIGAYMTNATGGNTGLSFYTASYSNALKAQMVIDHSGKVGIGTTTPTALLSVAGTMDAKEIIVEVDAGTAPDYVFAADYQLSSLKETASYIKVHSHLPEVPSAKEMETDGVNLGEMNMLLLKKIEELTLHLIAQQDRLDKQEELILKLAKSIK